MGFNIEMPPELRGSELQQLSQVRSYLFRLAEALGVAFDSISGDQAATPASSGEVLSARDYNELRDMISISEKNVFTEVKREVEKQLKIAEESGDFDGNGIDSVVFNDDYTITFGFTDGTFYTTPVLKGEPGEAGGQYAVGDIFITTRNGDPSDLLGYGTWEQIKDRFLLAAGDSYAAGATGGEAAHMLMESELPKITGNAGANIASHSSEDLGSGALRYDYISLAGNMSGGSSFPYGKITLDFGGDQPHNNMPPYLAVYMWIRTA